MKAFGALCRSQTQAFGIGSESHVGIVLPQEYAIFCPRSKHSVRFVNAFHHQIIDEHADVGFVAPEGEAAGMRVSTAVSAFQCRIDAGDYALARCFLISRRSVYLSGEEEPIQLPAFQCVVQLGGVEEVIFYGVARPEDLYIAEAGHGLQRLYLHIHRQRR